MRFPTTCSPHFSVPKSPRLETDLKSLSITRHLPEDFPKAKLAGQPSSDMLVKSSTQK